MASCQTVRRNRNGKFVGVWRTRLSNNGFDGPSHRKRGWYNWYRFALLSEPNPVPRSKPPLPILFFFFVCLLFSLFFCSKLLRSKPCALGLGGVCQTVHERKTPRNKSSALFTVTMGAADPHGRRRMRINTPVFMKGQPHALTLQYDSRGQSIF